MKSFLVDSQSLGKKLNNENNEKCSIFIIWDRRRLENTNYDVTELFIQFGNLYVNLIATFIDISMLFLFNR